MADFEKRALLFIATVAGLAGFVADCGPRASSEMLASPPARSTATFPYPDLASLYEGEQGIYRSCGPTQGVCHNGREFPNLASLGSIVDGVGAPCNQKRDAPSEMNDLCERRGDLFRSGDATSELGWVRERKKREGASRVFDIHLRSAVAIDADTPSSIERVGPKGPMTLLTFEGDDVHVAKTDPTGLTIVVRFSEEQSEPEVDASSSIVERLAHAGVVADPMSIQLGDPNENGVFGADLGGRLIVPGDPAKSYLLTRLVDPSAGPLMPRANCCAWSKPALRALFCWVSGLRADGSNALAPIDYERCPADPGAAVDYPELGPTCDTSGMCPVHAHAASVDASTVGPVFRGIYDRVLHASCAGSGCHGDGPVAGIDLRSPERAVATLRADIAPGKPEASELYRRISPDLCKPPKCALMPLGRPPLSPADRETIRAWIAHGATAE